MFSLTLASGRPGLNVSDTVCREGWGWMDDPRFSFLIFFFTLKSAYYYCKSFLPTIGGLDPRVPPGSVLLYSTVKLAPWVRDVCSVASKHGRKMEKA